MPEREHALAIVIRDRTHSGDRHIARNQNSRNRNQIDKKTCDNGGCVRIGVGENVTRLKSFSTNAYSQLAAYTVMSYYKFCAIGKARGILRNYSKARTKNLETKELYARCAQLTTL